MKYIALIFCFFFIHYSFAQKAVIGTPLTQVVYAGIENPLEIAYPGVSKKDLVLKVHSGCLLVHGNPDFSIIPSAGFNTCSLVLGIKKGNAIRWVDTLVIPIRPFPKGEVRFGTLTNGDYPLADLLSINRITYYNSFYIKDWDSNVNIISFRLLVLQTGRMSETLIMGPSIPADTKKTMFKDLAPGDLIVIDAVKMTLFGIEQLLDPLQIRVAQGGEVIEPEPVENIQNSYKLDTLSDSTFIFESYYPDGRVFQQGKVLKGTMYNAYHFLSDESNSTEPYKRLLSGIPEGYFPISKWDVFDSVGHHLITLNYAAMRDSILMHGTKFTIDWLGKSHTIAPHGQCIFYKNDGSIEEIIYYNMGKRR